MCYCTTDYHLARHEHAGSPPPVSYNGSNVLWCNLKLATCCARNLWSGKSTHAMLHMAPAVSTPNMKISATTDSLSAQLSFLLEVMQCRRPPTATHQPFQSVALPSVVLHTEYGLQTCQHVRTVVRWNSP